MISLKRINREEKGQAIVEWAIILPLLLLILFSILELGPLMNGFLKVEKAAQYGSRVGAIYGNSNEKILEGVSLNLQGTANVTSYNVGQNTDFNGDGVMDKFYQANNGAIEVYISPAEQSQRINGSWSMVTVRYHYPIYTPMIQTVFQVGGMMYSGNGCSGRCYTITRYAIQRIE